jgi:hypothetical protein
MIDRAAYGAETVKAMGQAFDRAWGEIAGDFSGTSRIETARTQLAEALLSVATEGAVDVEALKTGALEAMAQKCRSNLQSREKSS